MLTNGSFEDNPPPGGCVAGTTTLPGWTVGAGNIDIDSASCSGIAAADGTYWVDLTGSFGAGAGAISQSVATHAGDTYTLGFYFGGNPQWHCLPYPNDGPIKAMTATVNGAVVGSYSVDTSASSCNNPGWTYETVNFTAAAAQTTVGFDSLNGAGGTTFGPLLDGVTVVDVPEPALVSLMTASLVGLLMRRRRTNRC